MLPELHDSYAAYFASALLDPARTAPSGVTGPGGKAAGRRYDVYRNNVMVSLIDALASIYPAVQRITGPDFFRAMARFHIRETPPVSPLLFEYGHDFPVFIEGYAYAQSMPWLSDVARIERAWLDAYHAADAAPLPAAALAHIASEQLAGLTFTAHPAARIVRSHFSAVTIFAANRESGPAVRIDASASEDALITRPEFAVVVRRMRSGGAIFAASLISGHPLGVATAAALDDTPDFDIASNIAGLIEAGAFTSVNSGDP
ncbi:MAG TPA: DNA-binding domain-containing protein [Bradyrhizobium sp.]|nr:DNA-binding domain-containing protein [Bradyrhizobium sp.]